jgi:hypothetical protein
MEIRNPLIREVMAVSDYLYAIYSWQVKDITHTKTLLTTLSAGKLRAETWKDGRLEYSGSMFDCIRAYDKL